MKNLYRRYRPLRLSEVVGQEQVTRPLESALKAGKIGHAYLFVGPRGCGKTSVARILAHEVNGFEYELEDDYVDIIEIDGASNRGIDNIRELREKVAIAPTLGKYKIYIIDEVHMLTKEAFNALLKTLEEPPAHAIFIMATTDAYKVPVTITSRAQTYTFKLAEIEVILKHLKKIAEKEKIKISDGALEIIARRGGGSFRDSLSLLDQISTLSEDEITKDLVVTAMGLPEDEKIAELLASYISGDITKVTMILKDLWASGIKAETLTEEMIRQIVAKPKAELLPLLAKLPEVKAPYAEAKLLVALANEGGLSLMSRSGARPAGPSTEVVRQSSSRKNEQVRSSLDSFGGPPRAAGATSRAAALRTPLRQDISATPSQDQLATTISNQDFTLQKKQVLATAPSQDQLATSTAFDWDGFLERVRQKEGGVYMKLTKVAHEINDNELHIYPNTKPTYNYLAKDHVKTTLMDAASGVKITIHETGETPSMVKKDATLDKISAIMGGEVINDGGRNPFA